MKSESNVFHRVPHTKPPFTLSEVRKAIPPHCFQRSVLRSFSYVVHDLTLVYLLYHVATRYIHHLPPPFSYLAWLVYWTLQGAVMNGVFVLGHDCGHQAFSDYQSLNDTIGLVLHSCLFIPYFSWKHSHRRHHANTARHLYPTRFPLLKDQPCQLSATLSYIFLTWVRYTSTGSLDTEEVFVPKRKSAMKWYSKYFNNNPIGRVITITLTLALGWPSYLAFNTSGRPYARFASHFDPFSPMYSGGKRLQIFISDAGVLAFVYGLSRVAAVKGFAWVVSVYVVPLLFMNGYLVLVSLLHHTHLSLPHYDSSEWDWFRGALATVDRDYGVLNWVFHNTTDAHVAHHLFSMMPHYHAKEATKAMKDVLGEYYQFDATPILRALWRDAKECVYVEAEDGDEVKGVYWYKNKV